ncbi:MAG TPA: Wadjet anti-phage system protein JetD domain-containing protein [Gemmataceae bacterium]|jgi:hypothetical protein|nr:Wadjet anti-phage system protein JetD domain-containing protein [Gemmataceae bacterium]
MWDRPEHRLALMELVVSGRLRCRKAQREAWRHLAELPWTRCTGRRDELAVVDSRRHELERLLTQVWPEWPAVGAELTGAGLPISMTGWLQLQDIERARAAKGLPPRLNRRTATAVVGPHSKASLSAPRREALAELDVMHDGTLRLRTPKGLRLRRGEQELDCATIAGVLGEVILTERALADGTVLTGQPPQAILLLENVGAYLDTPAPAGWLLAHVPGWDTPTVRLLLRQLRDVPVAHFGDLDPNGVRIMRHLRELRPDLRWVVPDFWHEYVRKFGLKAAWPSGFDVADAPALVKQLASSGIWLEQEAIVLDPRLSQALAHCVASTD